MTKTLVAAAQAMSGKKRRLGQLNIIGTTTRYLQVLLAGSPEGADQ